ARSGCVPVDVEPSRGDEVEVGDDAPQLCVLVVLVTMFEDEDGMDVERRHHARDDAERRLGRAADDAQAHRVLHGCRLEGDGTRLLVVLDIDHANASSGECSARRATAVASAASATAAATAGATVRLKTLGTT